MDWSVVHDLNELIRTHDLLEDPLTLFASLAVTVYAVATVALWFVSRPEGARRLRLACISALTAAGLGLLVNQAIGHLWDRPRPYLAHPHALVLFTAPSHDPSFPSDHATASFAIAVAVWSSADASERSSSSSRLQSRSRACCSACTTRRTCSRAR